MIQYNKNLLLFYYHNIVGLGIVVAMAAIEFYKFSAFVYPLVLSLPLSLSIAPSQPSRFINIQFKLNREKNVLKSRRRALSVANARIYNIIIIIEWREKRKGKKATHTRRALLCRERKGNEKNWQNVNMHIHNATLLLWYT